MTDKSDGPSVFGWVRGDEAPEPTVDELRFREQRFRRGAHHAADCLASAIERAESVDMCQRIATIYTNLIGDARHQDGGDFDLSALAIEAVRRAQQPDQPDSDD